MQEDLDRSRRCWATIKQKPTSMDWESVKDLSSRQKVSRWIKNLSRSYRDKVQKARWIEIALTSIETRRKRGSIDSNQSRGVKKLSRLLKNSFSRREKHRYECNQACYSTKDPNNILNTQNHLSTKKKCQAYRSKTHTHIH